MPTSAEPHIEIENRILATLPRQEYKRLSSHFDRIHLPQGKILSEVGDDVRHAYFLTGGTVSLLSLTADGAVVEIAMVGNEGMIAFRRQRVI